MWHLFVFSYHIMTRQTAIRFLGLSLVACTVTVPSSVHAAEPQEIQAAKVELQNCFRVSIGSNRSNAERILRVLLSSGGNFISFGRAKCLIGFSPKERLTYIASSFVFVSSLTLIEVGNAVLRNLPFPIEKFGPLKEDVVSNERLYITSGHSSDIKLGIVIIKEGYNYSLGVNETNSSIIQEDMPGFIAQ